MGAAAVKWPPSAGDSAGARFCSGEGGETGYRGAWFLAEVLAAPSTPGGKYTLAFKDFVRDTDSNELLVEEVLEENLRPLNPMSFGPSLVQVEMYDAIEVLWQHAWWEGFVAYKKEDYIGVYFPGEPDFMMFQLEQSHVLRPGGVFSTTKKQWCPKIFASYKIPVGVSRRHRELKFYRPKEQGVATKPQPTKLPKKQGKEVKAKAQPTKKRASKVAGEAEALKAFCTRSRLHHLLKMGPNPMVNDLQGCIVRVQHRQGAYRLLFLESVLFNKDSREVQVVLSEQEGQPSPLTDLSDHKFSPKEFNDLAKRPGSSERLTSANIDRVSRTIEELARNAPLFEKARVLEMKRENVSQLRHGAWQEKVQYLEAQLGATRADLHQSLRET